MLDQVAEIELRGGAAGGQARAHLAGRVVQLPLAVAAAVEVLAVDAGDGAGVVHACVHARCKGAGCRLSSQDAIACMMEGSTHSAGQASQPRTA